VALKLAWLAKKIALSFVSGDNILSVVLFISFLVGAVFFLFVVVPIVLLASVPSFLLGGDGIDQTTLDTQQATMEIYENAPNKIDSEIVSWIKSERTRLNHVDTFSVTNNFSLDWRYLAAIDAVLLSQDFSNVSEGDVIKTARKFLIKNSRVKEREEERIITKDVECSSCQGTGLDFLGANCSSCQGTGIIQEKEIEIVTTHHAFVSISSKSFSDIVQEVFSEEEDKLLAKNILEVLKNQESEESP